MIRDMCCCGLHASEEHNERREKGGEVEGWMAPELCVLLGIASHMGLRDGRGENKPDFYPETGNKRFTESILTQLF